MAIDRIKAILEQHGIRMSVSGCGCCGSPTVSFEYNGEKILDEADDASFTTFPCADCGGQIEEPYAQLCKACDKKRVEQAQAAREAEQALHPQESEEQHQERLRKMHVDAAANAVELPEGGW